MTPKFAWLCWIGLHKWSFYEWGETDDDFESPILFDRCRRCGRVEGSTLADHQRKEIGP